MELDPYFDKVEYQRAEGFTGSFAPESCSVRF